jgi:hypothetical protein
MLRGTVLRRTPSKLQQIKQHRNRVAQQFATLEGWQHGQDPAFDAYVKEKRAAQHFDGFDQRVERAFQRMSKLHKAEVWNSYKRRLKSSGEKLTVKVMTEIRSAAQERENWLRDVFSQIDADYRCDDPERQEKAAAEISRALSGDPGDFMSWLYERRQQARFMGPKGKAQLEAEDEGTDLPPVLEEEVNRFMSLKPSMKALQTAVIQKYGLAGDNHWMLLQLQKDSEYAVKLEAAKEKYQELRKQQANYDESVATMEVRHRVARAHTNQVRLKAALEMEAERERLIEAHQEMKKERIEQQKAERKKLLQKAEELRAEGKPTDEVAELLKEQKMSQLIYDHNRALERQKSEIVKKKHTFLGMIEKMRAQVEEREGRELMGMGSSTGSDSIESTDGNGRKATTSFTEEESKLWNDAKSTAAELREQSVTSQKKVLWAKLYEDKWQDPFLQVHQARMDARKTFDPAYSKMDPTKMASEMWEWNRGDGAGAYGTGQERTILTSGGKVQQSYFWQTTHSFKHSIDTDGKRTYVHGSNAMWAVEDPVTMDVDLRYERKDGLGPVWEGPKMYKIGNDLDRIEAQPKLSRPK